LSTFGFRIPVRAATSGNLRVLNPFHRAAIVKRERRATAQAFHAAGGKPLPADGRFLVKLVRIGPNELDQEDNLTGSLKAVRDEVAKQLGLPNDRVERIIWAYDQRSEGHLVTRNAKGRKGKTGIYAVEVWVHAQRCPECHVEHCDCIHLEAPCSTCADREVRA
jgi:hypothetical protein